MRSSRLVILLAALVFLPGCAKQNSPCTPEVQRVSIVERPARPNWPLFVNGDFRWMTVEARTRMAQRHAMTVWYIRQLES